MLDAVADEQPFVLLHGTGPMMEGEYSEIAWLGFEQEGEYRLVQYNTSGGGCCPPLPRVVYRRLCSEFAIKSSNGLPVCISVNDTEQEVCACGDSLWFNSLPCDQI